TDLFNDQKYIFAQFHLPYLTNQEKMILISLLYNLFKENIISFKRYTWDGFLYNFSTIDFYNFNEKEFFYTKDLFEQYFLYVKKILGEELPKSTKMIVSNIKFWLKNRKIEDLIENVNKRVRSEINHLQKTELHALSDLHLNLKEVLINREEYEKARKRNYFKQHVKSIKFFPNFHIFGLSHYFLYITPSNFNNLDYKLLLTNTFQKIKHNSYIDSSNSLLISYIFPLEDPSTSYLNWLR
ncbi:MAG: hypothetical protein P8Y23_19150, partial [Candidatus Lokiarchaeota archaeon]